MTKPLPTHFRKYENRESYEEEHKSSHFPLMRSNMTVYFLSYAYTLTKICIFTICVYITYVHKHMYITYVQKVAPPTHKQTHPFYPTFQGLAVIYLVSCLWFKEKSSTSTV